jgi:hypothetical protein
MVNYFARLDMSGKGGASSLEVGRCLAKKVMALEKKMIARFPSYEDTVGKRREEIGKRTRGPSSQVQ